MSCPFGFKAAAEDDGDAGAASAGSEEEREPGVKVPKSAAERAANKRNLKPSCPIGAQEEDDVSCLPRPVICAQRALWRASSRARTVAT